MSAPTTLPIPHTAATIVTGLALSLGVAPAIALLGWWSLNGFLLFVSIVLSLVGIAIFLVGLYHALQRYDRHTDLSGAGEAPVASARPKTHLSSPDPVATSVPGGRWGIGAPTE